MNKLQKPRRQIHGYVYRNRLIMWGYNFSVRWEVWDKLHLLMERELLIQFDKLKFLKEMV